MIRVHQEGDPDSRRKDDVGYRILPSLPDPDCNHYSNSVAIEDLDASTNDEVRRDCAKAHSNSTVEDGGRQARDILRLAHS